MSSARNSLAFARLRRAGKTTALPVPADSPSELDAPSAPAPSPPDAARRSADDAARPTTTHERLELIGPVPLPVLVAGRHHTARWYVATTDTERPDAETTVNVVAFGDLSDTRLLPLARVHSACATGDLFGSQRCDCGPQLQAALEQIARAPAGGMLVHLPAQEGRGIGLWAKAAAYLLQDDGLDTYEANWALGFDDDHRDYRWAASVLLHFFGSRRFRLLTNNPEKAAQLRRLGLEGLVAHSHVVGVGERNRGYLAAKRNHGHAIPSAAIEAQPASTDSGEEAGDG